MGCWIGSQGFGGDRSGRLSKWCDEGYDERGEVSQLEVGGWTADGGKCSLVELEGAVASSR